MRRYGKYFWKYHCWLKKSPNFWNAGYGKYIWKHGKKWIHDVWSNFWNAGIWQPAILLYQKDSLDLVCFLDTWCFSTSHIRHVDTFSIFILTVSPSNPMVSKESLGSAQTLFFPTTCTSCLELNHTCWEVQYLSTPSCPDSSIHVPNRPPNPPRNL